VYLGGVLAAATVNLAAAADAAKPAEDLKREAQIAAQSNLSDIPRPQLSANTNVGPEVPMARETNPAAAPVARETPAAPRPRNTLWMVLAVLAVLLGSHFLKRLRSKSGPS
jgi:hypothetical protein